ncbi:MAG: phage virion morphogenesis protein [Cyanobacteria bacterium J06559_3]
MFELETEADAVLRVIADIESRAKDWTPALNEAALYMEAQTKENFAKQQDPDGNPWQPLAQSTLIQKRKRKAPSAILRDTSSLVSGITARPASATQSSVETTANRTAGLWHQRGTKRMPQRRYMGFAQRHIDAIEQILKGHVDG